MPLIPRLLFGLTLLLAGPTAVAQPTTPLTDAHRATLVADVSELLTDVYVFPEVAEEMVALVEGKLEAGDYDRIDSLPALAEQLTADLHSVNRDLHLSLRAVPPPTPGAAGGEPSEAERNARRLEAGRAQNFGFRRVELLPGNIGYIDLRGFFDAGLGGETAIAAMNFVAHADALIFDLRQNGGGSPSMIQLITSYLFDEPQHLNSFYVRRTDRTEQFWTQAAVPGPKLLDTPVYVLTSGRTFSAAEEFSYNLRNMERATLVGETTGGGAHPVETPLLDLGDGLWVQVSMPFGRAINPITGTNWEGTGVAPHIETPAEQALEVAQVHALERLAEAAESDEARFTYDWARAELTHRLDPPPHTMDGVGDLVGQYGPRRIYVDDERLWYQREGRPPLELTPMAQADTWHVGDLDYFRLRFVRDGDGDVVELHGLYADGRTDRSPRSGD